MLRPFQPTQIQGVQVWFDGADVSTVTTSGGNAVSEWRDKSGFGRHAVQANPTYQPVFVENARYGRSAILFTGDWLITNSTATWGTVFLVWEHPASATIFDGLFSMRSSFSDKTAASSMGLNLTISSTLVYAYEPFPTGFSCRANRVPQTTFANFTPGITPRTSPDRWNTLTATFTPNSGAKNLVLGADTFTAALRGVQNAHIAEFIAYDRVLGSADINRIEDYFKQKWGTP